MIYVSLKEINKYNVIETHSDVFKNELTIYSMHLKEDHKYNWVSLHKDVPLDVIYKSNPSGEKIFLVFDDLNTYNFRGVDLIVLNIDGKKNIEIKGNYHFKTIDEFFEITKDQFYELCCASSLMIQLSGKHGISWEGEANSFITILQAVYNEAFDNTLFKEAKDKISSFFNSQIEIIREKKEKNKKQIKNFFIIAIISLFVTIVAILGACFSPWWILFMIIAIVAGLASFIFFLLGISKVE